MPIDDTFSSPLASHTGESGVTWEDAGGGSAVIKGIQPNDTFHRASEIPTSPDYSVSLELACLGQPIGARVYLIGRWTGDDTGPYYAAVVLSSTAGKKLSIIKVIAAQQTDLAEAELDANVQSVTLSFDGNQITASAEGAELTVTDDDITAAGRVGFYGNGNADPRHGIVIHRMTGL